MPNFTEKVNYMRRKVLSIAIPSYNVEAYLEKNVSSLAETTVADLLDIIIVDDGSIDKTSQVADGLADRFDCARVIHKENGGYGSAVNRAIEVAEGTYFCVVDADDYVDSPVFEQFIDRLKGIDADLVLNDYREVDPDGETIGVYRQSDKLPVNSVFRLEEWAREFDPFSTGCIGVHTECVKTGILKGMPPCHEHHFYVDREYSLYPLVEIKTAAYINLVSRCYLLGREGQSADRKTQIKHYEQATDVTEYLYAWWKENRSFFVSHPNIEWCYFRHALHHDRMCYAMQLSNQDRAGGKAKIKSHDEWVRGNWPEFYASNPYVPVSILRKSNFHLFGLASFVYRKTLMK